MTDRKRLLAEIKYYFEQHGNYSNETFMKQIKLYYSKSYKPLP